LKKEGIDFFSDVFFFGGGGGSHTYQAKPTKYLHWLDTGDGWEDIGRKQSYSGCKILRKYCN